MFRALSTRHAVKLHAGGAVLGTGALAYVFVNPIHLDAARDKRHEEYLRSQIPSSKTTGQTLLTSSLLGKKKPVSNFDPNNPPDVDKLLREYQQSHIAPGGSGVSECHVAQTSSNNPSEDDHAEAILPVPSGYWSFFAVFDGHAGWETSAWLRENLIPAVTGALADLFEKYHQGAGLGELSTPSAEEVEVTFKDIFKQVDDDLVRRPLERVLSGESRSKAMNALAPAWAGSCALLSFYDSESKVLHTAITGDSRAILGRRGKDEDGNVSYSVYLLSAEQDGKNPAEITRLFMEHPGELPVQNDRILGIAVSRAFGDGRWKWSINEQKELKKRYLGRSLLPHFKTPPYLTAEPEVTSVQIQPGDFLIMGTDGLWECLTSEDAVGLVAWWHENKPRTKVLKPEQLPVQFDEDYKGDTVRYQQWNAKKEFMKVDDNAATHLIRNALGGADSDLTAALFSTRSRSRTFMDDITALVVFFDDEKQA